MPSFGRFKLVEVSYLIGHPCLACECISAAVCEVFCYVEMHVVSIQVVKCHGVAKCLNVTCRSVFHLLLPMHGHLYDVSIIDIEYW